MQELEVLIIDRDTVVRQDVLDIKQSFRRHFGRRHFELRKFRYERLLGMECEVEQDLWMFVDVRERDFVEYIQPPTFSSAAILANLTSCLFHQFSNYLIASLVKLNNKLEREIISSPD